MTDLEKIISEIESAAEREAGEIIAKAEAEAEGILSAAANDAERQAAESGSEAERRTAEILSAGDSARQRSRREHILETKHMLISEVLDQVKDKLYTLPDDENCAFLAKLAVSAAFAGEGVVILNENDKKRLPPDFESMLADMLPAGFQLKISDESRPIDGGLILKYGGMEQNYSFEAIFNARREEFSDLIHNTLFTAE